jgi:hypothetical protein
MAQAQEIISLRACPHPFKAVAAEHSLPPGMTIAEMALAVQPDALLRRHGHAFIGDRYIPRDQWDRIIPASGDRVIIRLTPTGGGGKKNVLSIVLSIAVLAAGAAFGAELGLAIFGDLGSIGGLSISTALGKGLISGVGFLLQSVIAPPAAPRMTSNGGRSVSPTLFIQGARNQLNPYGPVKVIFGKHVVIPDLGARTYTETVGDEQYVRQIFLWGRAPLNLYDIKIGDTPLADFHDVEAQHYLDGSPPATIALYPNRVDEQPLSVEVKQVDGWQVQTSHADANEIMVDLTWPTGLWQYYSDGTLHAASIAFDIGISPAGAGTWTDTSYSLTLTQTAALRRSYRFVVGTPGQYDVRVRRTKVDDPPNITAADAFYWTALRTFIYGPPLTQDGVAFSVLRMKATGQLNGQVDQLSAVVASEMPDWDSGTSTWITRETQNPASHYRYVLQTEDGVRGLADARVDIATLQYWHEQNAVRGFKYNAVIDFTTTMAAQLDEIAPAGRAARAVMDGKWSVVIDEEKSAPVQMFTPRNSWGYKGSINYPDVPHAFRTPFVNETKGFINDERVVYADGYSEFGAEPGTVAATKFLTLEQPGITHPDLIYIHDREHLASMVLQPETHTFFTDIEHLVCTRGDLIQFAHDVILAGLGSARVKSIDNDGAGTPNATGVTLDNDLTMEAGKSYALRFRLADNSQILKTLVTVPGTGRHFNFAAPFPLTAAPAAGDLATFGESGLESRALLIKGITPGAQMSAKITAIDYAPARFSAGSGTIPAFDSGATFPPALMRPAPPVILSIQTDETVAVRNIDGSVQTRMVVRLQNVNQAAVAPVVRIRQTGTDDFEPATVVSATAERVILTGCESNIDYDIEISYRKLDAQSVLAANLHSAPVTQTVLFIGESGRPDDVTSFDIQALGSVGLGTWNMNQNIDFSHYAIKFSPVTNGSATWNTMQFVAGLDDLIVNYTQFALQRGTYMIKAYDRQGNESLNADVFIYDADPLSAFLVITTLTEDPAFSGSKTNCTVASSKLKLTTPSLMTGTYNFATVIDNGQSYTSRLTASITAFGDNPGNVMSSWATLSGVSSLSGSDPSNWSAVLQVSLTDGDPAGSPTWSAWQDFAIGDYSFRAARFRLILTSVDGVTNPTVSGLSVNSSMLQRTEGEHGITTGTGGYAVTYSPAFKTVPVVHVTLLDGVSGDKIILTGPSGSGLPDRTGFKVLVDTSGGSAVSRTANWSATGYGRQL